MSIARRGSSVPLPAYRSRFDGQMVGKTASGSFLMVEVNPGSHRVSGLSSESDQGITIAALADSSYFVKIWPKMGVASARSGVEQMDPVEGRRAVQGARMVPATWSGEPIKPTP